MNKEKMMILKMLEEGKINSEEAMKLINAIKYVENDNKESQDIFNKEIKEDIKKSVDNFQMYAGNIGGKVGSEIENTLTKIFSGIKNITPSLDLNNYNYSENHIDIFNIPKNQSIDLDVQALNGDIKIKNTDDKSISLNIKISSMDKLSKNMDDYYMCEFKENTLYFQPKVQSNISIELILSLPKTNYRNLKIKTSNGNFQGKDIKLEDLNIQTFNGNIFLSDILAGTTNLKTSNGKIILDEIESDELFADTSNGSIELYSINSQIIKAQTKNARIKSIELNSMNLYFNTSNAPIELNRTDSNKIEAYTTNAPISIGLSDKNKDFYFDLTGSTGNIIIDIPNIIYELKENNYIFKNSILAQTKNYSNDENKIIAKTSHGPIKIY